MCMMKKPKVVSAPAQKEAGILRNPYLDGIDPILRAQRGGVKGLTIRRGSAGTVSVPRPQPSIQIPTSPIGGGMGRNEAQGLGKFGQMLDAIEAKNARDKQSFANLLTIK
ncbi:hypothetical protein WEU32_06925 [Brevundimonas sp. BH3]|uniref:hypothetical protein n=1 Tax=Brevundimonas sp. BH3 TaxID=3133089 RepID=UPI00324A88C0